MSDTIFIEAVGPRYWTFMATVMASRLDKFINSREITPGDIPKGVYDDAREYFELVMGAVSSTLPEDPPASINAYVTAMDALKGSLRPFPETDEALVANLSNYAEFLRGLTGPHRIADERELQTVTSLRDFFRSLAEDGENETYLRAVRHDHRPNGYQLTW